MTQLKKVNEERRPVLRDQLVTVLDLDMLKNEMLVAIKRMLVENEPQKSKQWIKSYEVKRLLKISTGTLQNLRANGELPFCKLGGTIYYDMTDINRMMEQRKISVVKGMIPALKKHAI